MSKVKRTYTEILIKNDYIRNVSCENIKMVKSIFYCFNFDRTNLAKKIIPMDQAKPYQTQKEKHTCLGIVVRKDQLSGKQGKIY